MHGMRFKRYDLVITREEADMIMVQQGVKLAKSDFKSMCVSENMDIFIHFYHQENLSCKLTKESTAKEHIVIDIEAAVKVHANVVLNILAVHCISRCNIVSQFFGVGNKMYGKQHKQAFLCPLGIIQSPLTYIYNEVLTA